MAALSGYCAAAAVARWWKEGLPPWSEFYRRPDDAPVPETTSEEYIARYEAWQ